MDRSYKPKIACRKIRFKLSDKEKNKLKSTIKKRKATTFDKNVIENLGWDNNFIIIETREILCVYTIYIYYF